MIDRDKYMFRLFRAWEDIAGAIYDKDQNLFNELQKIRRQFWEVVEAKHIYSAEPVDKKAVLSGKGGEA